MTAAAFVLLASLTAASEWRNLIQKDSFAGWRSPSGKTPLEGAWEVKDGVLTVKPFVQHRTDLWTVNDYRDFELEWEWRADKGANSGVKYRVQQAITLVVVEEDKKWRPVADPSVAPKDTTLEYTRGLEYQMADDEFEPTSRKRADSRSGGLYSLFPPSPENVKRHGEWNQSRLLVRGGKVEHWLNGKLVLAYDEAKLSARLKETKASLRVAQNRGPLALQYHQTRVAFRKMRVRDL